MGPLPDGGLSVGICRLRRGCPRCGTHSHASRPKAASPSLAACTYMELFASAACGPEAWGSSVAPCLQRRGDRWGRGVGSRAACAQPQVRRLHRLLDAELPLEQSEQVFATHSTERGAQGGSSLRSEALPMARSSPAARACAARVWPMAQSQQPSSAKAVRISCRQRAGRKCVLPALVLTPSQGFVCSPGS